MDEQSANSTHWYLPVTLVTTILAFIATFLRFYTRALLTRSVGSDDFALILPIISAVTGAVVDIRDLNEGWGRHEKYVSAGNVETVQKYTFVAGWMRAFITFFFLRASIMLFTLRLLPCTKKWPRRIIYVAFFLNFAITLIALVGYGVRCHPTRAAYAEVPNAHCKSEAILVASQRTNGVLACVIDITTALIPAFLLWDLQLRRSTKVFLDAIFFLGFLTAALSVSRAVTTTPATWGPDATYTDTIPGIMSSVEISMGIFFASCPVLRQFCTYCLRNRTFLPTDNRIPPNSDFKAMRKRIALRDIFWYRQTAPNEESLPPNTNPTTPKDISQERLDVKYSALDRIWAMCSKAFKPRKRASVSTSENGMVEQDPESNAGNRTGENVGVANKKRRARTFLISGTEDGG